MGSINDHAMVRAWTRSLHDEVRSFSRNSKFHQVKSLKCDTKSEFATVCDRLSQLLRHILVLAEFESYLSRA